MHRLWMKIRMPLAVVVLLVIMLAVARLFSGPEDTWIKNDSGEWIKHGYPSGLPPAQDYREPITHVIIPLTFLVAFTVPLFFIRFYKLHNRLNYETAKRDIKFLGYVSTVLFLFGILIGLGLIFEIGFAENGDLQLQEFLLIISIEGFAGLCIILGALLFILKRNFNDHFQIERTHREIIEILENYQLK